MKYLTYALPVTAALLLILFFSGLPDLKRCSLPDPRPKARRMGRRDALPLLTLCLVYALTAFWNLGDRKAPESFVPLGGRIVELRLPEGAAPARALLSSGIGQGSYLLESSPDGESHAPLAEFEQDHVAVLKWSAVELSWPEGAGYLRLTGIGRPWLGELVLLDESGAAIPYACELPELCDEQDTAPAVSDFSFMNSSYFDEIYHARTAWEHLHGIWPYEISHPPLGKLILSLGILLLGMNPFGWRFMGTLAGVLMLPVTYALLKRLFGGRAVPFLGTAVLAADFMHFVQTRIATIDSYAVLFILLMYYFMWVWLSEGSRRNLALSGICFGLGAASKWTCLYAGAGLGVLWLGHWALAYGKALRARSAGNSDFRLPNSEFLRNIAFCLVFFVLVPGLIYYLSYLPYGAAEGCGPLSAKYLRLVLDNQSFMFNYHANIVAEHPYSSRWYQWLLDIRPILYYLYYFPDGSRSSIAAFVSPTLCWGGLLSLFVLGYEALFRRDRRAAFLLIGYLAQLLPWVFISRLTFAYHYFPCSVFLVLALGYVFALLRDNVRGWHWYAGGFAAVSLLLFVLFYPCLSGAPIDNVLGTRLMGWLPSWPL